MMADSNSSKAVGVVGDAEQILDHAFQHMCDNTKCAIPGLVVCARRGGFRYHKAFGKGTADGSSMTLDAQFRCFSMTKVLTSVVALRLSELGVLNIEDSVAEYIKSFDREWKVVCADAAGPNSVEYTSFLTGKTTPLPYSEQPASKTMLVKHLMAESSGIGYDQWTDIDLWQGNIENPTLGLEYGVAQALRKQRGNGYYTSNCIIGQDLSLEAFCDEIASAGVLVCEPGTFSYGLGALVLGRVCEIAYSNLPGKTSTRFSKIVDEFIFKPLDMTSAAFYLDDGDPRIERIPVLYGGMLRTQADFSGSDGCDVKPYSECLPESGYPNTVATDTYAGPRKCDSGDTGATMTASDYAKFYECLLRGGLAENGTRILSDESVHTLTHGIHKGLDRSSLVAKFMGLTDADQCSFNFGWAREPTTDNTPHCNFWSGYANNHGKLYVEDDSYFCIFPQFMGSSQGGWALGGATVRDAATKAFMSIWT